jgi:hypothetical protein
MSKKKTVDAGKNLIDQAVDVIMRLQRASVSSIQRRLKIPYTKACAVMDVLEACGVVGPVAPGGEPRTILAVSASAAYELTKDATLVEATLSDKPETPQPEAPAQDAAGSPADKRAAAAKAAKPHIEKSKERRQLKCVLTQDELLQAGRVSADATDELQRLYAEAEEWKTQHKAKQTTAAGKVDANASMIRSGYEFRQVECEHVSDFDKGEVRVTRLDTSEVIERRQMNSDEQQMGMSL